MIFVSNIKLLFSILASLLIVFGGFVPYARDIFLNKTKPHAYTWLIWTITQGVALLGILFGKGGWGALSLGIGTFFVFVTFLVSLKYGTKNITKFDTAIFILALLAIIVWFQMHNPLLSVIMVTIADFLGYVPSFRKTFQEPWTETVISWVLFFVAGLFIILSLSEYNFLTLFYLITTDVANVTLICICLLRRRKIRYNKSI